jgi:hypothetical protein
MLTRRTLFALAAAALIDPEKLLWKPGRLISIPRYEYYPFGEIDHYHGFWWQPGGGISHALLGDHDKNRAIWEVLRSDEQGARLLCNTSGVPRLADLVRQYRFGRAA